MHNWIEEFCKAGNDDKCDPTGFINMGIYEDFLPKYNQIAEEANKSLESNFASKVEVGYLDSFISFVEEESYQENKDEIVKILITKMLEGDEISNAIFSEIYSSEGKDDLLLSYTKIKSDATLDFVHKNVHDGSALAVTQAVYWLESEEANHTNPELVDWYHECCSFDIDVGS